MGGGEIPRIPDYKEFKVDGLKELEWVQEKLAAKGLKDPWLRNEVWRYRQWPGWGKSTWITLGRGLKYAAGLMIITIAADTAFGLTASKQHGHGDHH